MIWDLDPDDLAAQTKFVLKEEPAFNRAAGLGKGTDILPDFFKEEALLPFDGVFEEPASEIESVLDF